MRKRLYYAGTLLTLLAGAGLHQIKAQTAEPRVIDVVARRFAFEPSTIEVAVGEPIVLRVKSADGPHGLEIKQLKVKQEIPRGTDPISIPFTAKEPGRFPIICSEYCGTDHDSMRGMLVVQAASGGQR